MKFLNFILISICFMACTKVQEKDDKNDSGLHYSKRIEIDISNQEYPSKNYYSYKTDSIHYLIGFNNRASQFSLYDLTNEIFLKSVDIKSSELLVDELAQFHVHSLDSILLIDIINEEVFLLDTTGQIYKEWELDLSYPESINTQYEYINSLSHAELGSPFLYSAGENALFFHIFCHNGGNNIADYYQYPPVAEVILTENEQEPQLFGKFPESYLQEKIPLNSVNTLCQTQDDFLLSFAASDSVYFKNENKFYAIKSQYENEKWFLIDKESSTDLGSLTPKIDQSGAYLQLVYDQWNNNILRVFRHPYAEKDNDGLFNRVEDADWSLIIFSLDSMKIQHEYRWSGSAYDYRYVFPEQQGFWLIKSTKKSDQKLILERFDYE